MSHIAQPSLDDARTGSSPYTPFPLLGPSTFTFGRLE
jgi:hypothetical protein